MPSDQLVISQDGSHTILSERFGVSYHSKYGALQETETVFIQAGLQSAVDQGLSTIRILEMGFGTGLNALMTLVYPQVAEIEINYSTIEAYPLGSDQYTALNYPTTLNLSAAQHNQFLQMHTADHAQQLTLNEGFTFTKYITDIESFFADQKYDLIYYDAFAPTSQPHLWTEDMMCRLASMCEGGAVLVTYCAKGSFKRALRAAGFSVEGLPGPIGKREMTRATYKG